MVQLYITDEEASFRVPHYSLKGFQRISLNPGETKMVTFEIGDSELEVVNEEGEKVIEKGAYKIFIGGSNPSERNVELGANTGVSAQLLLK